MTLHPPSGVYPERSEKVQDKLCEPGEGYRPKFSKQIPRVSKKTPALEMPATRVSIFSVNF